MKTNRARHRCASRVRPYLRVLEHQRVVENHRFRQFARLAALADTGVHR
ncbi:hypothetical protein GCM10009799_36280 [Nocardiopsis rhodophaea]|uniref:Transposase n=1 Tax=Nocardiopsis rhodophaea TaxID=280238 RepID=A0ABN2TEL4_9ACTN